MTTAPIHPQIVAARREKAVHLQRMAESCRTLQQRLTALKSATAGLDGLESPAFADAHAEIGAMLTAVFTFQERLALRLERFQNGLITIAIAGLEKAGKTTFLKALTGIQELPAFDERCTAVCCEVIYGEDRADFDMDFHTESAFLDQVLRPMMETVAADLPDAHKGALNCPRSADAFAEMTLPAPELLPGGTTAYKLLCDLHTLQRHFHECRAYLGRPSIQGRPLSELSDWVSYQQADLEGETAAEAGARHMARVSAAKRCRIHTPFQGGSPHLRWIDTPGVDDPNRRSRELTLRTIAADADLLVVVSRPGATPSPTESFHHFWDSVSRLPDEVDLLSRMLFVLNLDRRVDPEGRNIRVHQKYLMDAGVPKHLFIGPYEAIDPAGAAALMDAVNHHLKSHLDTQDDQTVLHFERQIKTLQARVRLLADSLAGAHPSDTGLQDEETEAFHKWFHWYGPQGDTGFWSDLVTALEKATREILTDDRILASETRLNAIFAEEAQEIQTRIPTPDALAAYVVRHRGENPIPHGMRMLSILFSRLVNRLAGEVQEFGPIMQEKLAAIFEEAGLSPLLTGDGAEEKLDHLVACLAMGDTRADNAVLDVLRETLELPRNLKYVIRYELRPAVDFCDPTLWNANEDAKKRLWEMVHANGGETAGLSIFDTYRYPPVTDDREKDHDMLRRIAANALLGVQAALGNDRYLPRRIADDFIRDCRIRLCFSPESEQQWRALLLRNRGVLLAGAIGRIRERSDQIRGFQTALRELESVLA